MLNKFLTWLDGYDRKTGTYTRAISPNDSLKGFIILVIPIIAITVLITTLILRSC